jgi:coenzyme F420-reducing hydrogenase gamma subunit
MNFEDVKIGMKVQIKQDGLGFSEHYYGRQGVVTRIDDEKGGYDVCVSFSGEVYDWGNAEGIEPVVDVVKTLIVTKGCAYKTIEQQTLEQLLQGIQVALEQGNLEAIEALSKAYQRIKSTSNQTEVQPTLGETTV